MWTCCGILVLILIAVLALGKQRRTTAKGSTEAGSGRSSAPIKISYRHEVAPDHARLENNINVAGTFAEGRPQLIEGWAKVPRGHTLRLRAEPDNPHDPNAIAVDGLGGGLNRPTPIGYLPKHVAARLTETGGIDDVRAEVRSIWIGGHHKVVAYVRIDLIAERPRKKAYGRQLGEG